MWIDASLQTVMIGTGLLGFVAGSLGTFALLRRQSLLGDTVSHAALPGIVIAFMLVGKWPLGLVAGAAVAGVLAMGAVTAITRNSRIPVDTAMAGSLAVFFGAGLVLLRATQGDGSAGIDKYLFGQAATLIWTDVVRIAVLGAVALGVVALLWKEFALVTFDREFAAGLGYPVLALDALLTGLLVVSIVIGLEAVGVVLMSTLVVAPAAAARQWTDRLAIVVLLAGAFGAAAGFGGSVLSHELSGDGRRVPTGPTIVLCATLLVAVSFAVRYGRRAVARRAAAAG